MLSGRKKRVHDFFPQVNDRRWRFKLLITIEGKEKGRGRSIAMDDKHCSLDFVGKACSTFIAPVGAWEGKTWLQRGGVETRCAVAGGAV